LGLAAREQSSIVARMVALGSGAALRVRRVDPRARLARPTSGAQTVECAQARFAHDVHEGLGRAPKTLPSLYFYDDRGSELFRRIMELPEYYLTRAERECLERHGPRLLAPLCAAGCDVVDLGAGDGLKARILLEQLRRGGTEPRYFPIDVSEHALQTVLGACSQELPWLEAQGVVAEYGEGLRWLGARDGARPRLVLMLGSNIGNLSMSAAERFLVALRTSLRPGDHVLIGFDLLKDVAVLQRAYDDAAGVTAQFNLNLLRRINRELRADFDPAAFRHFAAFSPTRQAMESYLLSVRRQRVQVDGTRYEFEAWEPIHTEISCKYRPSDVSALASAAGFIEAGYGSDERHFFLDALWRVPAAAEGA
jgi:L-histidine N-alpha-methyltransferase